LTKAAACRVRGVPDGTHPFSQLTVEQLEKMILGAVSLAAATTKDKAAPPNFEEVGTAMRSVAGKVLAGFQASAAAGEFADNWHNKILWVDNRPENNLFERRAFESMGLEITLALSTNEALPALSARKFAAIISDISRKEGPREGYVLLEELRRLTRPRPISSIRVSVRLSTAVMPLYWEHKARPTSLRNSSIWLPARCVRPRHNSASSRLVSSCPALAPAMLMRLGLFHKCIPPIRRVCFAQQRCEHRVGIVAAACLA